MLKLIYFGSSSIEELKKYIFETPASITQKLANLEKKGLIERTLDKEDKRKWIFNITQKGGEVYIATQELNNEVSSEIFKSISAIESDTLLRILMKLKDTLRSYK